MNTYPINKSRTIEITFTDWNVNDIIVELARYINDGFKITAYNYSLAKYEECSVSVVLIKA